jgi:hypothetical protein
MRILGQAAFASIVFFSGLCEAAEIDHMLTLTRHAENPALMRAQSPSSPGLSKPEGSNDMAKLASKTVDPRLLVTTKRGRQNGFALLKKGQSDAQAFNLGRTDNYNLSRHGGDALLTR